MTALLIIIGTALVIVLFLLILQNREMKNLSRQLEEILSHDTNELLHSENSSVSYELINSINNLLKKVNETKQNYNRKSHDMEQMITNISHDLRTPLTSAMGYVNIILNSDMTDYEKEIRIVEQRLIRLEELINSFFEFSKIISENKIPEKQQLNLVSILQDSIVHYYDDFNCQNRMINFICDKSRIKIFSNLNMLMRIFDNLIGNAYKHGEGNLIIEVIQADSIIISFKNELHTSDIDISRLFDEFYTTDISRTKGNTGLGLSIAKQFTLMLDGEISADYKDNIFTVSLTLSQKN